MKRGFTLIELSIVLVIIALLIGGIMVAQSMTETARSQKYVRELQNFKILYDNFVHTFKEKPGDFTRRVEIFAEANAGDGDGLIEWNGVEAGQFWNDLNKGNRGVLLKDYKIIGGHYLASDKQASSITNIKFYYPNSGDLYNTDPPGIGQEASITYATRPLGGASVNGVAIKAAVLLAIDRKVDDGLPWGGKVRGHTGNIMATNVLTTCSQDMGGIREYKVDEGEDNCRMLFLPDRN